MAVGLVDGNLRWPAYFCNADKADRHVTRGSRQNLIRPLSAINARPKLAPIKS
ncbi:hypothetical protein K239x_36840 [Planctomycetes bacterium K23_9]|uniref:Uncharacterized protein n=1 Tax=Stieleria marina TaxID=1930275 RepID=A0A517NX32_9BACT|nr:hypothetical protein K239x_36840 [Planctomycetes bacterium K23_9]